MPIRQDPGDGAVERTRRKDGRFRECDCHKLRSTVDKVDVEAVTVRLEDRVRGRLPPDTQRARTSAADIKVRRTAGFP